MVITYSCYKLTMSFRVVRDSKFRHVFGQPAKRQDSYDGIRITKSSWDSPFCVVNPKFLAIITEAGGGGAFIVIPLSMVGKIARDYPLIAGHRGPVLDISWCPFNDNVIASGSEDCTVKVWQIPDKWPHRLNMEEPVVDLVMHQRRVGIVLWHPTANNILLSAGSDFKVYVWNVGTGEALVEINCHPDLIFDCCFNYNGSKLVTVCKDKKIRVIDPRTGEVLQEGQGHEGAKPQKAKFLKDGYIFTTGFSRMSERQYALRNEVKLEEPIVQEEIDNSNAILWPFYDADTSLMYLIGKGDCNMRYFEITEEYPYVHFINTYQSNEPQRGMGMMPKRGCDVNINEITRFFKLTTKGLCEPISMTVPRKSELFQDDLYPDTQGDVPSLSAEDWFNGLDADPILISLKGGYKPAQSQQKELKVTRKSNILDKMPNKPVGNATVGGGANVEALMKEVKNLTETVKRQEKRIKDLEERLDLIEKIDKLEKSVGLV